jgi:hypothetical protein
MGGLSEPPPNTKVANSKFKNGARFRRAKTKFLDRREALRNPEFIETERRLRPADAGQKLPHHPLVWITSAALKFVLLDACLAKAAAYSAVCQCLSIDE